MIEIDLRTLEEIALKDNMKNRVRYINGEITQQELERKNMEESLKLVAYRAANKKNLLSEFISAVYSNKK